MATNETNCTHDCSSCSADCASRKPESLLAPANKGSRVKNVVAVMSGKGGVGKSMVTSTLAVLMQRRGYKVGILDADITGPSIPKAFGQHTQLMGGEEGIEPAVTKTGIKMVSINLLLEDESAPVIWRGPVIGGCVKQFWTDVEWGDIDIMFVDMPPGTGDVPLTVFQSLPVDGAVVVTSPQELVGMIVGKAVSMANMMNIPVWGIAENMSYYTCPDCGKQHFIFGDSHLETVAAENGVELTARLPIDPMLARHCDRGIIEIFEGDWLDKMADGIEARMQQEIKQ